MRKKPELSKRLLNVHSIDIDENIRLAISDTEVFLFFVHKLKINIIILMVTSTLKVLVSCSAKSKL